MLTLMLVFACTRGFASEIFVPTYTHWSVDHSGSRLYCAKEENQKAIVAELWPAQTQPLVIAEVDMNLMHQFQVSRHGNWAAIVGANRLTLLKLDDPANVHTFDMDVVGAEFVDDSGPVKVLVATAGGSVFLLTLDGSRTDKKRLRGSLNRPGINQTFLAVEGARYLLPNQGQVIDLRQLSVEATKEEMPGLTVYDSCSATTQFDEYVRVETEYEPGENTHVTWNSNVLLKGRINSGRSIEERVAYRTRDRIYNCVLTLDDVVWLQTASWNEDYQGIRLRRVKLD